MADRVLFISWRTPVRGREERGLEVFNESMGLDGRINKRAGSRSSTSSCWSRAAV